MQYKAGFFRSGLKEAALLLRPETSMQIQREFR